MNILKHKSWHVYNKQNIERVRQDERRAAEEQERRDAKAQFAEQERRIASLRSQKHARLPDIDDAVEASERPSKASKLERFSLFDEPPNAGTNPEYEDDKRKEKEKLERQYTMYLGQDRAGPPQLPWYMRSKEETKRDDSNSHKVNNETNKKDLRLKREDPMAGHISNHKPQSSETSKRKALPIPTSSSPAFDIQKLREQRLKREASERHKTNVLINSGKPPDEIIKHKEDDRFYHSQFNPDFVRKPATGGGRRSGEVGDRNRHNVRFA
ncbi:hypothetical protein SeMB42_g07280 [Synchytrium endobioticum]|uniref:CBF1-interacting co-repressor CIR N-terminal domain-containing protein n=1 Tax=Synchytrium endobioticum TaxID=286115 RepID=A0A507CKB1_9FUNG|nr:hypothetical protein SeMB42_g07280 [Synchytrium endobioticum]TPX38694.1 hypothetical protein SeLEV6574_g07685 [Synchytrium endobioticum]